MTRATLIAAWTVATLWLGSDAGLTVGALFLLAFGAIAAVIVPVGMALGGARRARSLSAKRRRKAAPLAHRHHCASMRTCVVREQRSWWK